MSELTKDADKLICAIYKHYLKRREYGTPKSDAKMLGSSEQIQKNCVSNWIVEDVDDTCRELGRNGYLQNLYADDSVYQSILTDDAIFYMKTDFPMG